MSLTFEQKNLLLERLEAIPRFGFLPTEARAEIADALAYYLTADTLAEYCRGAILEFAEYPGVQPLIEHWHRKFGAGDQAERAQKQAPVKRQYGVLRGRGPFADMDYSAVYLPHAPAVEPAKRGKRDTSAPPKRADARGMFDSESGVE